MKPKLLFVDDSPKRCAEAQEKYGDRYDVILAHNVTEALRQISGNSISSISLDHDLNGQDYQDPNDPTCGMEIIRYIARTGWPTERYKPDFTIHSTNLFAAKLMYDVLTDMGFAVWETPWGWKKYQHGAVAGAFDVMHYGYVLLLREAKDLCHKVTVLLHDKPDQVFDLFARKTILLGLRYVDDVIIYKTEDELTSLLLQLKPDVRIMGSDHEGDSTRPNIGIKTVYHKRDHAWSATMYKERIAQKVSK